MYPLKYVTRSWTLYKDAVCHFILCVEIWIQRSKTTLGKLHIIFVLPTLIIKWFIRVYSSNNLNFFPTSTSEYLSITSSSAYNKRVTSFLLTILTPLEPVVAYCLISHSFWCYWIWRQSDFSVYSLYLWLLHIRFSGKHLKVFSPSIKAIYYIVNIIFSR